MLITKNLDVTTRHSLSLTCKKFNEVFKKNQTKRVPPNEEDKYNGLLVFDLNGFKDFWKGMPLKEISEMIEEAFTDIGHHLQNLTSINWLSIDFDSQTWKKGVTHARYIRQTVQYFGLKRVEKIFGDIEQLLKKESRDTTLISNLIHMGKLSIIEGQIQMYPAFIKVTNFVEQNLETSLYEDQDKSSLEIDNVIVDTQIMFPHRVDMDYGEEWSKVMIQNGGDNVKENYSSKKEKSKKG